MFQKFIEQSDQSKSGDVSLAEFIHYVREHEKKLQLQFRSLDVNKDGKDHDIDAATYS
jgi:solute carrier family 25 (mitochondrial phosphate transporter), member 23/24/25/41